MYKGATSFPGLKDYSSPGSVIENVYGNHPYQLNGVHEPSEDTKNTLSVKKKSAESD